MRRPSSGISCCLSVSEVRVSSADPSPAPRLAGEELIHGFRKRGLFNIKDNSFKPDHVPTAKSVGSFLVGAAAFYKKKQVRRPLILKSPRIVRDHDSLFNLNHVRVCVRCAPSTLNGPASPRRMTW